MPIWISGGMDDPIATPSLEGAVQGSLQRAGFKRVRVERFMGRHWLKKIRDSARVALVPGAGRILGQPIKKETIGCGFQGGGLQTAEERAAVWKPPFLGFAGARASYSNRLRAPGCG